MAYEPRVYLCGPIQHASDHGKGWRARIKERDGFHWLDPFDKYDNTSNEGEEWSEQQIVENDLEMIAESDALLVHWENVPTCGTPMEIRHAHNLGIPVVVQTTVPSEQLSPWLEYHASAIVETFNKATNSLKPLLEVEQ